MTTCQANWDYDEYEREDVPRDDDCDKPAVARTLIGSEPLMVCDDHAATGDLRLKDLP